MSHVAIGRVRVAKKGGTREPWSTKTTKKCASSTGGPGNSGVDQSTWRKQLRERRIKFDDKAKQRFLEHFSKTSRMMDSAKSAGVTLNTVRSHIENDPEFAEMFEEAREAYRDRCHQHADMLMFEGVQKPVIGGQYKDEIIAYVTEYSVALLQMELKRVDPSYKERTEIDLNAKGGGVLVAPADQTPEQWIKEQQALNEQRKMPEGLGDDAGV